MQFEKGNFDIYDLGRQFSEEEFFRALENINYYKKMDLQKLFKHGIPIQKPDVYRYVNEHRDFIEVDVFYYKDKVTACAILCDDQSPWRDFCGVGEHKDDKDIAVNLAIEHLNKQAY